MFVPSSALPFDLRRLIESAIAHWSSVKSAGAIQSGTESYGDFIAMELNARGLRQIDQQHDDALFSSTASPKQFKEAVTAALDRWLVETDPHPQTPEEASDYTRPLGE